MLGDHLVVGLNSDDWLTRKKGKPFLGWLDRASIISELKMVSEVIHFDDSDNTAINAIIKVMTKYPNSHVVFANGGDRGKDNIPEMQFESERVSYEFGIGGNDKMNSSSWILKKWEE